jgi:hypothetical protein
MRLADGAVIDGISKVVKFASRFPNTTVISLPKAYSKNNFTPGNAWMALR